jgi:hypothetical protein
VATNFCVVLTLLHSSDLQDRVTGVVEHHVCIAAINHCRWPCLHRQAHTYFTRETMNPL